MRSARPLHRCSTARFHHRDKWTTCLAQGKAEPAGSQRQDDNVKPIRTCVEMVDPCLWGLSGYGSVYHHRAADSRNRRWTMAASPA
jgi:hypothetical protein